MRIPDKLREVLHMTVRRDPEVARQIHDTAVVVRTNGRLLREIRAIQGQLERPRPSLHHPGDATWNSKTSSSS